MGCTSSCKAEKKSPASSAQSSYDRRPKISVRVGPDVRKLDSSIRVIFIFGGPGSRKGRIVDDLCQSYNFRHISTEEIIYTDLPKKVADVAKIDSVRDIKDLVEADPSHITAEWIMSMIEKRIENDGDSLATYMVDFVPNLKYMLRLDSLLNCRQALESFEEKYPISFAINLAIPADKVLRTKQVFCATPEAQEKMKETGGQGDEADSGRIQKRAALFESNAKGFLEYFSTSNRLVTVDVTCGVADLIWYRVHQLLCDLDFHPFRSVNTVILFAFDEQDAADIDYDKYLMVKVQLSSIADNPQDSVSNLLAVLNRYIDNQSKKADSFVVILTGTSVTRQAMAQVKKRLIMFNEVKDAYMETYLPGSPKNYVPKPSSRKYKAICSMENEVCLFPSDTSNATCTSIALAVAEGRRH